MSMLRVASMLTLVTGLIIPALGDDVGAETTHIASVAKFERLPAVGAAGPGSLLPEGPLHTSGNQIVSAAGHYVRLAGINWFGLETPGFAPQGLWAQDYKSMMDQMLALGFNVIRLPFSLQLFEPDSIPSGINDKLNPDLVNLRGPQIMDQLVAYAGKVGLRVILDSHSAMAGSGPNPSGLWYDGRYTEAHWIATWVMLARRYANNPTVIGADLLNEPHDPATWGDGSALDWAAAATRAGNSILAVNPNWLIFVEGIQTWQNHRTWWGGNLMAVAYHPIVLSVPNRIVYSPHDYPASVHVQPWLSAAEFPNNLPDVWISMWGYIYSQNVAPVFVGEYGAKLTTEADRQWLDHLVGFMNGTLVVPASIHVRATSAQGISWAYWAWNPTSADTDGILGMDWRTVDQAKIAAIEPAMYYPSR